MLKDFIAQQRETANSLFQTVARDLEISKDRHSDPGV